MNFVAVTSNSNAKKTYAHNLDRNTILTSIMYEKQSNNLRLNFKKVNCVHP